MSNPNLGETPLLDHGHESLRTLIRERGWQSLAVGHRVGAIYSFVRDEIPFGYNASDRIAASQVLADGYGQCNTKTTLLMALLRGAGIPCRFHGATIHKRLQKGVVTGLFYWLAPTSIIHSWAEVLVGGRWASLEGVILDRGYLDGLRSLLPDQRRAFVGYAVGTDNLATPPIDWRGTDTAIQMTGVDHDLGVHDDPDRFYARQGGTLSGFKEWLYRHWVRHRMNRKVASIRGCFYRQPPAMSEQESRSPSTTAWSPGSTVTFASMNR
jgi:hypothetical protein